MEKITISTVHPTARFGKANLMRQSLVIYRETSAKRMDKRRLYHCEPSFDYITDDTMLEKSQSKNS